MCEDAEPKRLPVCWHNSAFLRYESTVIDLTEYKEAGERTGFKKLYREIFFGQALVAPGCKPSAVREAPAWRFNMRSTASGTCSNSLDLSKK